MEYAWKFFQPHRSLIRSYIYLSFILSLKVRKEFTSEVDSATAAFRSLSVSSSGGHADLTQLFRIAAHEAKKSRSQNRILRVVSEFWSLFMYVGRLAGQKFNCCLCKATVVVNKSAKLDHMISFQNVLLIDY